MLDIVNIKERLEASSLVEDVDTVERGHVRIETGLRYPDGSSIDVFLVNASELKLSDFGQTMGWLLDVQVKPWLSKKRQAMLDQSIKLFDVSQDGGSLEYRLANVSDIGVGVLRLAQACARVADLNFTRRSSLQSTFSYDVEDTISDCDLQYETNAKLAGRYGKPIRVDFLVTGARVVSSVLTLSSGSSSQAHNASTEIFRKWHDLSTRSEQRVTIFDDRRDVYREDDLQSLRDTSTLVAFSDKESLKNLLAA